MEELIFYAPIAPQMPTVRTGRAHRALILLFPQKCAIQSSGLVGINQHQNIVEAPLVIQNMLGILDSVFALILDQVSSRNWATLLLSAMASFRSSLVWSEMVKL